MQVTDNNRLVSIIVKVILTSVFVCLVFIKSNKFNNEYSDPRFYIFIISILFLIVLKLLFEKKIKQLSYSFFSPLQHNCSSLLAHLKHSSACSNFLTWQSLEATIFM